MFTGIITALGTVRAIEPIAAGKDMRLLIETPAAFMAEPPVGSAHPSPVPAAA